MEYREIDLLKGYKIGRDGSVLSKRDGKPMRIICKTNGLNRCYIKNKSYLVAELVALAFCGSRDLDVYYAYHIDGDNHNDHAENIEWRKRKKDLTYKPIPGYPNYEISERGDVYNLVSKQHMCVHLDKDGYYKVHISNNGSVDTWFIHRLVAMTYLERPENCNVVNHLDSNRTNNHYTNLEWTTAHGNYIHGMIHGRINAQGENNPRCRLTVEQVKDIRSQYAAGSRIADIQRQYSLVTWEDIKSIVMYKTWKHLD